MTSQEKMLKKEVNLLCILLFGIFLISIVSAEVTCNEHSVYLSYIEGEIPNGDIIITSCSSDNSTTINLDGVGVPGYIQKGSDNSVISGTKNLRIEIDSSIPSGIYFPRFYFDDSESVYITLNIEEDEEPIDPYACQINPSIVEYNQDFQQGAQTTETITFNPRNCEGEISISDVNIQGGIVDNSGKKKPVSKGVVTPNEININIDTEGLPSKTYDNIKLTFYAYGEQYTIKFTIRVSGSAGGSGDFNINGLPSCSLTNNIINLNQSHSLVCSGLIPDVDIVPRIDTDYIRGLNKEVEANQFSWIFEGKKMGNTEICADFYYLGVPVGDSFCQELKIQSLSGQTPGTSLTLSFTPTLSEINGGETISIQILDNKSQSLVDNPELYIDGEFIENMTGKSFRYIFNVGKVYSIRAISPGYNDLVEEIEINETPTTFTISPEKEFYVLNEQVTLTSEQNCSFLIDNVVISTFPYALNSVNNQTLIECVKEGYVTSNKTIDVRDSVTYTSSSPEFDKWKKGKKVVLGLTKNISWSVYDDGELKTSGEGDLVEFKIDDYGYWEIKSGDIGIVSKSIVKTNSWKNLWGSFEWTWRNWWKWLIELVIILVVVYFLFIRKKSDNDLGQPIENAYREE